VGPQGDVPASPGGPLRRRREKRQLRALTADSKNRQTDPSTAKPHIRMLDGQANEEAAPAVQDLGEETEPVTESHRIGFHVRPIPIDQPFDET
jgi:hypothetical protein